MASVQLLSTLALRGVLQEVTPLYEQRRDGHSLVIEYGATQELIERIKKGAKADAVLLTASGVAELQQDGVLHAEHHAALCRSDIGVGIRSDASPPDISSVETFKAALLGAGAVAYSDIGASGIYFKDLLRRLGIAEQVNANARVVSPGLTGSLVVNGEADLAVQQVSELMQVPGLRIAGVLPPAIQQSTVFSIGVFKDAAALDAAMDLVKFLTSSQVAHVMTRRGLKPVHRKRP